MNESATAASVLSEVERVRGRTRETLDAGWLPYFVFGALTMLSAPFTQVGDGGAEGLYWLAAGPVGLAITWLYYRRHELEIGLVDRQEYLLAGIVATMVLGAIAVGWATAGDFSEAGWIFPIGAGLLAIGALESSPLDAAIGVALLMVAGALIAIEPAEPGTWAALLAGTILLAGGLAVRTWGR